MTKRLIIIWIAVMATVISVVLFTITTNKQSTIKLDNLIISESDNASISNLALTYQDTNKKISEPNIEAEKAALNFALQANKALFNTKELSQQDFEKQFFEPLDKEKLKDINYILSEEFKFRTSRSTRFWAQGCWLRNHDAFSNDPIKQEVIYSSADRFIVRVYMDDIHFFDVDDGTKNDDMNCSGLDDSKGAKIEYTVDEIIEYTVIKKDNKLWIYDINTTALRDLADYSTQVAINENKDYENGFDLTASTNKYSSRTVNAYDYSKVKLLAQNSVERVYQDIAKSTAILSYRDSGIIGGSTGIGFFVRKGVIATSWTAIKNAVNKNIKSIHVSDFTNKLSKVDGVIYISTDMDLAIIKLEDEIGTPIDLNADFKPTYSEPLIAISSPMGLKNISKVGIFIEYLKRSYGNEIKASLPTSENELGAPVVSTDGQITGMVKIQTTNLSNDITAILPTNYIKKVVDKIKGITFKKIDSKPFSKLNATFKRSSNKSQIDDANNSFKNDKLYLDFKNLLSLTKPGSLIVSDVQKVSDNIVSIRVINQSPEYLSTGDVIKNYGNQLMKKDFKLIYSKNGKLTFGKKGMVVRIAPRVKYISLIYEEVKK